MNTARKVFSATMPTKNAAIHSMESMKRSMTPEDLAFLRGGCGPTMTPSGVISGLAVMVEVLPYLCPGRSAARSPCEAVRCRAGAVTNSGAWYGPGSAERHEECRTASGTRWCMPRRVSSGQRRAEIDAAQDDAGRIALEFDIEKLSRGAFLDAVAQPQELLL